MANFHPAKWNIACWVIFLVWLMISVVSNYPIDTSNAAQEVGLEELPGGTRIAAYDMAYLIGWPFCYLEINVPQIGPQTKKLSPWLAISNVLLITLNLVAIVFTIQTWMPRFSIRTLLLAMALISILIVTGQAVCSSENYFLATSFVNTVLFMPIIAACALSLYKFFKRQDQTLES